MRPCAGGANATSSNAVVAIATWAAIGPDLLNPNFMGPVNASLVKSRLKVADFRSFRSKCSARAEPVQQGEPNRPAELVEPPN